MRKSPDFPALLQSFFTQRMVTQRRASPHTIASYRDTFRLLLRFAQKRLHKAPSQLGMEDLNAPFLGAFLHDLENHRANGARSRNLRLTAIRSFFRYAALEIPQCSALIQRVLAIPNKRQSRPLVDFLNRPEIKALLAAPNPKSWLGRRDHALLLTAVQTGLRLSEITALRQSDITLGSGAHVRCQGKGRKERCTPLAKPTARVLTAWIKEQGEDNSEILFPSARGGPIEFRLRPVPRGQIRHCGKKELPILVAKACFTPRASPHCRHGATSGGSRSRAHCPLAGSRVSRNDPDLSRCRPCSEGEGVGKDYTHQKQTTTLPPG